MAAQSIRDSAIQSIQNVFNYTEHDEFRNRTIEEVQTRMDYLNEAFDRFVNNHQILVQRDLDAGEINNAQEQRDLFERTEENYLTTRARLQNQLHQLYQIDQQQPGNDNEELDVPNDERESITNNDNELDTPSEIDSNPAREMAVNEPPTTEGSQFAKLVERMCMSMANKKENSWGKYDGDLSKWQGFHDAFKAAVHDDDLIAPTFKLQFLKSSLEGRAAREFGEWPGGNDNYYLAWEWLKTQNQQDYTTSKTILWRLMSFVKMDRASGGAIQKLCTITQGVIRQLQAMRFPVKHYDMIIVHVVHDKLDPETSKDWELARKSETPTIKELTDFLQLRARALMYSQISEKKPQHENKKRAFNGKEHHYENKRAKNGSPNATQSNNESNKKSTNDKCTVCKEEHYVTQCTKFKRMPLRDRKIKVRELKLCYNCLSQHHQVRDCKAGECHRCKVKHNSLLCNENPYNKISNAAQVNKKNKQPPNKKQGNKKEHGNL